MRSVQMPPFRQGSLSHSFTSVDEQHRLNEQDISVLNVVEQFWLQIQ